MFAFVVVPILAVGFFFLILREERREADTTYWIWSSWASGFGSSPITARGVYRGRVILNRKPLSSHANVSNWNATWPTTVTWPTITPADVTQPTDIDITDPPTA